MPGAAPTFSIVIPAYNENESLPELLTAVDRAMRPWSGDFEILFVDDGSTDGTLDTLKRLTSTRRDIRVFSFRRNLGKSLALTCGFQMAAGRYILTLDADLQDDPANLQAMYEHLTREDVDVVNGWRKERQDGTLKIVSSRVFNLLVVRALFGWKLQDMNSGAKLYKAAVAKELQLYGGLHRFVPLIVRELGYRVAEIPVTHHARKFGTPKYRSTKVFTDLPDLLSVFFLLKYTRRPLHFFGRIGSALFVTGFVALAYLAFLWTRGIPIGTRPLLSFGVLLVLIGGQTIFTGLLADLIVNMNQNSVQRLPLRYASDQDITLEARARGEQQANPR